MLPVQLSRDREILLLFYEEGLSYQEIAQRLGCRFPPAAPGSPGQKALPRLSVPFPGFPD
ncbi:MAG: RNA polymerase sigma factor [Evtepia gabavorous]